MSDQERHDEKPRQLETRRGFSVSYRGKTLLSRIDPIGQADRLAGAAPVTNRTLYFCPSPLYGYGFSCLLNRISGDSAVLCVETDERLMALSLAAPAAPWDGNPRLRLVRTTDAAALCSFARETWGSRRFRRVTVLRLSGGWQLNPHVYDALAGALRRDIAVDWGNAMTLVKLGRRYIRNAIRNIPRIPCSRLLEDLRFGKAPALVLGAGPSLDLVLDGLSAAFRDLSLEARPFRIFCVDTALPSLKARNIRPDFAVVLESQHWNLGDFIGLGSWEIPAAMDLSALPATAEILRASLFITPWAPLRLFDRLEEAGFLPEAFPPLGSVGLTAAALARYLGNGPIILGGLDFAFTADAFHARATPGHRERLRGQTRFISLINAGAVFRRGVVPAKSKNGNSVHTDPAMKGYRDLFEREFSGESRFHDIIGPGLPLGLVSLTPENAFAVLRGIPEDGTSEDRPLQAGKPRDRVREGPGGNPKGRHEEAAAAMRAFIQRERDALLTLREILTGAVSVPADQLEERLDEADYLWAHFPECAGAEGRRPGAEDVSFLKRVRVEIEPLLKLWNLALEETKKS
jgi:hypothetical protein